MQNAHTPTIPDTVPRRPKPTIATLRAALWCAVALAAAALAASWAEVRTTSGGSLGSGGGDKNGGGEGSGGDGRGDGDGGGGGYGDGGGSGGGGPSGGGAGDGGGAGGGGFGEPSSQPGPSMNDMSSSGSNVPLPRKPNCFATSVPSSRKTILRDVWETMLASADTTKGQA